MTKEEIALELIKLCQNNILSTVYSTDAEDFSAAITNAYNYIYENLKIADK